MNVILTGAKRIYASLPTLGGQQLKDAERQLRALSEASHVLARQGLADAEDQSAIQAIIDQIDARQEEWVTALTAEIAQRYPETNLEYIEGTDWVDSLMTIETKLIGDLDHVTIAIDGAETIVPAKNVVHEGEALIIESTDGSVLLEMRLREVAAFGFVDTTGESEGWTGFDVLTLDGRFISLR